MVEKRIATKSTFGGCNVARIGPPAAKESAKAVNIVIGFDDALRLHLALGQALARLNSYNRATKEGRRAGITLSLQTESERITVNEGKLPPNSKAVQSAAD